MGFSQTVKNMKMTPSQQDPKKRDHPSSSHGRSKSIKTKNLDRSGGRRPPNRPLSHKYNKEREMPIFGISRQKSTNYFKDSIVEYKGRPKNQLRIYFSTRKREQKIPQPQMPNMSFKTPSPDLTPTTNTLQESHPFFTDDMILPSFSQTTENGKLEDVSPKIGQFDLSHSQKMSKTNFYRLNVRYLFFYFLRKFLRFIFSLFHFINFRLRI